MPDHDLHEPVLEWYAEHARDLPWRGKDVPPWAVVVSEFMLQQTSVARVLPVYEAWMQRWPTPAPLAAETPGEAVRAWGRLGYPRRALRLHATAVACVERHGGSVPTTRSELLALPGVGGYTAAAIEAFAFGRRAGVLDTNVRRVHARVLDGAEFESASVTVGERARALDLLPDDAGTAARFSVAVMELGALVCTAKNPRCSACPVAVHCTWNTSGRPPWTGPPRRGQAFAGTDRQVRGLLMAVLRGRDCAVEAAELAAVWDDHVQRARALDGLVADGLVEPLSGNRYQLPGMTGIIAS